MKAATALEVLAAFFCTNFQNAYNVKMYLLKKNKCAKNPKI